MASILLPTILYVQSSKGIHRMYPIEHADHCRVRVGFTLSLFTLDSLKGLWAAP